MATDRDADQKGDGEGAGGEGGAGGAPLLSPEERAGMLDFLAVYESHFDEMTARIFIAAASLPGLRKALSGLSRSTVQQRHRMSHLLVRNAIEHGEWKPLLETRRRQGQLYAGRGMPFREWFDVYADFQVTLTHHIVEAFSADRPRLTSALQGMSRYVHFSMSAIADAYEEARERTAVRLVKPIHRGAPN